MLLAILSALIFGLISSLDYKVLLDERLKDYIDALVSIVFIVILARPFMLFLVVPSVSKMLLTLVAMLSAVGGFGTLQICYLIMSTQIFSTLYQDINENYNSIFVSFRTTFDSMLGGYSYAGSGEQEEIFSALMIINLLISHVLLLNFMIAILS